MTSEYKKDLTYELRQRGLQDAAIADILDELPAEADADLMREFGEPKQYAASFPKGNRRTAGWWIITGAVSIAALAILVRVIGVLTNVTERSVGVSIAVLAGGIVVVAVAAVVAAAVDRRPVDTRR